MLEAVIVIGSLLLGFVIGRLWAVLIPIGGVAALFVASKLTSAADSDSPNESGVIFTALLVLCSACVLLGLGLRRLIGALRTET
jgi:hypothetical protein